MPEMSGPRKRMETAALSGEDFENKGLAKPARPVTPPKRPAGSKPPTPQTQVDQQAQGRDGAQ